MKFALTRENFFKNPRLFSGFQGPCLHGLLHRCSRTADKLLEAFVLRAARPPPSAPAATSVPWQMLTQLRALWHSTTPESYTLRERRHTLLHVRWPRDAGPGRHQPPEPEAGAPVAAPGGVDHRVGCTEPAGGWRPLCFFTHGPELAGRGPWVQMLFQSSRSSD